MRIALSVISNWVIFSGYLFVAFAVAPRVKLRYVVTRLSAVAFFCTCGLHHAENAMHVLFSYDDFIGSSMTTLHMLLIDVPQAISVWGFVVGLYLESVRWGPWSAGVDRDDGDPDG